MNTPELDALLAQTLADDKLSGGEKSQLLGWAQSNLGTDQDRAVARSRVFEIARQTATDDNTRNVLAWAEAAIKVVSPLGTGEGSPADAAAEACFSPGDSCRGQIAHRFATARRSADVCVFTITDDRISRAVFDAHRRGVIVRIISDDDKANDRGSDIARLADAGVPVRVDRSPYHMHHKFALFDDERLITGSYNWTRGAAEYNEENLIDIGDPRLLAAFRRAFDDLWAKLG